MEDCVLKEGMRKTTRGRRWAVVGYVGLGPITSPEAYRCRRGEIGRGDCYACKRVAGAK